jgi:hypothetical protein
LTPWVAGFLGFVVLAIGAQALMHRLSQSRLREDVSESVHEGRFSTHPFTSPATFRGNEQGQDYDPDFRESSEASRFGGGGDMTEVPLSQAMSAGSGGFGARNRSVSDPESEFGEISGADPSSYASSRSTHSEVNSVRKESQSRMPQPQSSMSSASVPRKSKASFGQPSTAHQTRNQAKSSAARTEGNGYASDSEFGFTRGPEDDNV